MKGLVDSLPEDGVIFAALKIKGVDKQENLSSVRAKTIFITWIGPKVGVLVKARVSVQKGEVQKIMKGHALSLEYNDKDLITMADLSKRLMTSGGAHKPTYYDFGGEDQHYSLASAAE